MRFFLLQEVKAPLLLSLPAIEVRAYTVTLDQHSFNALSGRSDDSGKTGRTADNHQYLASADTDVLRADASIAFTNHP